MRGVTMGGNPVNPTHVNDGTAPENRADAGLVPILEDHFDAGTILVLGNHVNEVTLIPKNHADEETVHIRTSMLIEVQTLPKSNSLVMLLWIP